MLPVRRGDHRRHGIARLDWRRLYRALAALLFPLKCPACGDTFHQGPETPTVPLTGGLSLSDARALNGLLCPGCISKFTPIRSPVCARCGIAFPGREGPDHLCHACITAPGRFTRARAVGAYDGPLTALVHGLKYKGNTTLARPLAALLFSGFQRFWDPDGIDWILPVPLHKKRMRRRGFNQAWLLIRDWPTRLEKAYGKACGIGVHPEYLYRHRSTDPQTGLDQQHRQRNLKNAFSVNRSAPIAGKKILLVDDVLTTGATVDECAGVLLAAGARQVDVLTLVRTM